MPTKEIQYYEIGVLISDVVFQCIRPNGVNNLTFNVVDDPLFGTGVNAEAELKNRAEKTVVNFILLDALFVFL